MKPNNSKRSGFIEYIAKRDGVIKNIESFAHKKVTPKQTHIINKLVDKFPNVKSSELYNVFLNNQTIGIASELITEIEENYFTQLNNIEEYVEYIAKRPRVIKEDSHGLFSSSDEKIVIDKVKNEIKNHKGNVWTAIISLKREDASRLTYEDLESWKILVRSQSNVLAKNLKIDYENFKWFGAFHNEAHHPHIHLIMYSTDEIQGYLNKVSIDNIRSAFAKQIFKHDLLNIYKKQTYYRDELKLASDTYLKAQINSINSNFKANENIEKRIIKLAEILKDLPGKHTYGYLNKPTKKLVDEIVNLLSKDKNVQELLDLWYLQRQEILNTYSDKKEEIRNLADIVAFRPVKNIVINVAKDIKPAPSIDLNKSIDTNVLDTPRLFIPTIKNSVFTVEDIANEKFIQKVASESLKTNDKESSDQNEIVSGSTKLFYHISKIFNKQLLSNAHTYHSDKEILKRIRQQKIALGQHEND